MQCPSHARNTFAYLALAFLFPAARAAAQTDILYVTNGDASVLQSFQGGNMLLDVMTHAIGYPLAVRDTIWIGDRDNGAGNPSAFEYDLNGIATGSAAPLEGIDRGNFVDGAVFDGATNYTLDAFFASPADVYRTDAQWGNPVLAFTVSGGSDYVGITYDQTTGTLFISDQNSVYQYSVAGVLMSQFPHVGNRGCLAWEPSTDTLWYVPQSSTSPLLQYSKTGTLLQSVATPTRSSNVWGAEFQVAAGPLGTPYCSPALPNSTGLPGSMSAMGSVLVASNSVTLSADMLPPSQFGYFLAGQTQGFTNPPGSQGILCLTGNIGRFNQVMNIIQGPMGTIQVDLTAIPVNPTQAVMPGETWNFQCWYRDVPATSNFTDALSITFL